MRKHIALALVTAMPLSLLAVGNGILSSVDPKSWQIPTLTSVHDVDTLKGAGQGILRALKLHGNTRKDATPNCSICCCALDDGACNEPSHTKKAAAYYGSQFIEGLLLGAQGYLICNHLYNQGPLAAGTQLGINFLSSEAVNRLVDSTKPKLDSKDNQATMLVRHLGASVVKRLIKLGLINVGFDNNVIFEPHKMRSFFKGTTMGLAADISNHALTRLNQKFSNNMYATARDWKRYEHQTLATKGAGAAVGAILARLLLEEKLDDLVHFLAQQVHEHTPHALHKLVSLTK